MASIMIKPDGRHCAKVRRRAVPETNSPTPPLAAAATTPPPDTAKPPASPLSPPIHAPTTLNGSKVNKFLNGHEAAQPNATPTPAQPAHEPPAQPTQPAPTPPAEPKAPVADIPNVAQPQPEPPVNPSSQVRSSKGDVEVIVRPLVAVDHPIINEEQNRSSTAFVSSLPSLPTSLHHASSSSPHPLLLTSHPPAQNPTPAAIPAAVPKAQNSPVEPQSGDPQQKAGSNEGGGAQGAPSVAGGQGSGRGAGQGGQVASTNSNAGRNDVAQGASPADSRSPARGSPPGVAFQLMQSSGVAEPNDRSGQGSGPDGLVPMPITITSKGIVQTSIVMVPPSGSAIPTNGKGSNIGNGKSGPTNASNSGTGLEATQPDTKTSKSSGTPVIVGVIFGIIILSILCGLVFFCLRKRRRDRNAVATFQPGRPSSNISTTIRGYFAKPEFQSQNSTTTARSQSPSLETGLSRQSMSGIDAASRIRSQSEPARRPYTVARNAFHNRAATNGSPTLPELHEANNPFLDPDADLSRSAIPATPNARTIAPPPASTRGRFGIANSSPLVPARSPSRSYPRRPPPMVPNRRMDTALDPFADPFADQDEGIGQSMPISEASRYSETSPTLSSGSRHSRSRTMANIPIITHTAPSIASSHHANSSSGSRGSPSLASGQFNGLGISRSGSGASQSSLYPTPLRSAARPAAALQRSAVEPALLSASNGPSKDKRLSNASASSGGSSSLSIEFPSSWGEPGPTRPGSMVHGSGGESGAGVAPSRPGASRVSDPFDLDVPELLSYAMNESHYSSASSTTPQNNGPANKAAPTVTTLGGELPNRRR